MEKMVCSIINPYRIADPMTYRILDWKHITSHLSQNNPKRRLWRRFGLLDYFGGVVYFSIKDFVSHGIAPIRNSCCRLINLTQHFHKVFGKFITGSYWNAYPMTLKILDHKSKTPNLTFNYPKLRLWRCVGLS